MKNRPSNRASRAIRARSQMAAFKSISLSVLQAPLARLAVFGRDSRRNPCASREPLPILGNEEPWRPAPR